MGIHNWSPKSKMQMKQVLLVCYEHNLCECSVGKRNCDRRYGLGDVEYLVNTDGDDSLLACPAVRRFRLLQLLVLYSEELVVATLVDVLLTDAPRCIVLAKATLCSMTAQPNKS